MESKYCVCVMNLFCLNLCSEIIEDYTFLKIFLYYYNIYIIIIFMYILCICTINSRLIEIFAVIHALYIVYNNS